MHQIQTIFEDRLSECHSYFPDMNGIPPFKSPKKLSQIFISFTASIDVQTTDITQAQQGGIRLLSLLVNREFMLMSCNDIWLLIACLFAICYMLMPVVQKEVPRTKD